jgi:hypothetical protein
MLTLVLLGMAKARANLKQRLGLCQKTERLKERGTYRDAGSAMPGRAQCPKDPKRKRRGNARPSDSSHGPHAPRLRLVVPCRLSAMSHSTESDPLFPSKSIHQPSGRYGRGVRESFVCMLLFVSTVANQSVICCILSSHAETDLASSILHQPEHIYHHQRLIKKPQRPSIT